MSQSNQHTLAALQDEIPRLRRFARYLCRDADYAEDLVQECLSRALANLESWKPGTNLRAWLFVILKNVFRNDRRRYKHQISHLYSLSDEGTTVAPAVQEAHLVLGEVEDGLNKLSREHREVLLLIVIEGASYEDASKMLNISLGTVKSRLSRARMALKDITDM